jgi:hypothetical protein
MAARIRAVNSKKAFLNKLPVFPVRNQRTNCSGFVAISIPLELSLITKMPANYQTIANQGQPLILKIMITEAVSEIKKAG